MKVLYIGQYQNGSTSKMRADVLKSILKTELFKVINTTIPYNSHNRIVKSIGFRYKKGPVISSVNKYITEQIGDTDFDLIWVDKGIYITEATTKILKESSIKLVHYTPDPAFTFHQSKHFYNSIKYYDVLLTTKKYELDAYKSVLDNKQVLKYVTQGFDKELHKVIKQFKDRDFAIAFVGHHENEREEILQKLLDENFTVHLAGIKWDAFVKKNKNNQKLLFYGNGVYGKDYVDLLNTCRFALGSVSKWVPEQHTTRTFEIPACGCILLTEYNEEISSFYTKDQVVYYADSNDLIKKLNALASDDEKQLRLAINGNKRVIEGGFDYHSILSQIVELISKN